MRASRDFGDAVLDRATFLEIDAMAAKGPSGTVCFERFGASEIDRALRIGKDQKRDHVEDIATCFMQPDLPEEEEEEALVVRSVAAIEETIEESARGRGGRGSRGKNEDADGEEERGQRQSRPGRGAEPLPAIRTLIATILPDLRDQGEGAE